MTATSPLLGPDFGPCVEVGDLFLVDALLALLEDLRRKGLNIGKVADRVLNRPTLSRGLRCPLPVAQGLEELVQMLLFGY